VLFLGSVFRLLLVLVLSCFCIVVGAFLVHFLCVCWCRVWAFLVVFLVYFSFNFVLLLRYFYYIFEQLLCLFLVYFRGTFDAFLKPFLSVLLLVHCWRFVSAISGYF